MKYLLVPAALTLACGASPSTRTSGPPLTVKLSVYADEPLRDCDATAPAEKHHVRTPTAAAGDTVTLCFTRPDATPLDIPPLLLPPAPPAQHWMLIVLDGEAWWVDHHDDA